MKQSWFEMNKLRKYQLDKSVWVPLRATKSIQNEIKFGSKGYFSEYIGHGSLMLPVEQKDNSYNLKWRDIGSGDAHCFNYLHGEYSSLEKYKSENFEGIHLVLNQSFDNNHDNQEWHLHQDLVINLGLKREGDTWVCPRLGYVEAVKLERDNKGNPQLIQIKNQFLKDYLNARDSGLYVTSFFSRDGIYDNESEVSWVNNCTRVEENRNVWECRVLEIHEGGMKYGEKMAVSHASRIDVDEDEDIPNMTTPPSEANIKSEFYEKTFEGDKLYRVMSDFWKCEWINPSESSPIVLGEEQQIEIFYIVDAKGKKESGSELSEGGKWLWFKPELVAALTSIRGGFLDWYTKNTGSISCAPSFGVHFGMNELGLLNVYAKDISDLPIWQQQIWASYNVLPEGGLSKELHASQVKAISVSTFAPEAYIQTVINEINQAAQEHLNINFFRGHSASNDIISSINRFRGVNDNGLLNLAKDIARIIVDDIDVKSIQTIANPPKNSNWKSNKTIEQFLSLKVKEEKARKIVSPFVGIYELRHGDAHLPSSDIENSYDLIDLNRNAPTVIQGYQMIYSCVRSLHIILSIICKWNENK